MLGQTLDIYIWALKRNKKFKGLRVKYIYIQFLLGSLLYVSKCIRNFNFLSEPIGGILEDKGHTKLTLETKRDIKWFVKFLPTFNGTMFFYHRPIYVSMELDASLQGLWARWGLQVYTITILIGYKNFIIVHLEMVNILAAIRVWGNQWMHETVSIVSDNEPVVQVLVRHLVRPATSDIGSHSKKYSISSGFL